MARRANGGGEGGKGRRDWQALLPCYLALAAGTRRSFAQRPVDRHGSACSLAGHGLIAPIAHGSQAPLRARARSRTVG
jgi:hypothetical protein